MEVFRGDIFYIAPGREDCCDFKEGRPGIIVSNNMGNTHSNYVEVVMLTTKEMKPMPTHVEIVCGQKGTALCETILSISKNRLGNFVRTCTSAEMQRIDEALMVSLGIVHEPIQPEEAEESVTEIVHINDVLPKIQAERDIYKQLYEQLLDKITR